ncbi:MAG: KUP/HAK/KT family potassium transporter [Opitutaceae bacterium]|nr:KUP/HAK/KT family potassium transporter [Cytophagales bacterium]
MIQGKDHKLGHMHRLSAGGLLVTLGIIYGDIGTSPLYVMDAIVGKSVIDEMLIMGALSCIFWTLTFQTTIKYVIFALRADNNGEGGIFSLYALIRRKFKGLVIPAMIGGAALLADGIITPPLSISSAVEGLQIYNPEIKTVPIVIGILILLFLVQRFGTKKVGWFFGPIMLVWFGMLAILGFNKVVVYPEIFKALNPIYGIDLLWNYPSGFWLLGAVFLCTTGAEALYSDLGHCGRENIRISWIFVKICLLLNYFGQGAYLLTLKGQTIHSKTFFAMMPEWFLIPGIVIATMAAIIASQALITGSFTLISEAVRLSLWPRVKIVFPTLHKGQLYVPSVNWVLLLGCVGVVLYFKESSHMEAAYGLSVTLTMLMTTFLLYFYVKAKKFPSFVAITLLLFYLTIEGSFLIANLTKFTHGGWVSLVIGSAIFLIMWVWYKATSIKNRLTEYVKLEEYYEVLKELSVDNSIPKYATNLIFMTSANRGDEIESKIIYSILQKQPKRADIYWFVHVDVTDEPYTMDYKVDVLVPQDVIRVTFKLGFRVENRINLFFRKAVEELVKSKEVDITSRYDSLNRKNVAGDFRFVVIEKFLSFENDLPISEQLVMDAYFFVKHYANSEEKWFGLDSSMVTVEQVPMIIRPVSDTKLNRVF